MCWRPQTLKQARAKTMKIEVRGKVAEGITAKDIVLAIIGKTTAAGGTGYVVEFCGEAITDLSMEGRMTVCNMAIELGCQSRPDCPPGPNHLQLHQRSQILAD